MIYKDIPTLTGTVNRFTRGEGHYVEIASIMGVDSTFLSNLFHDCNILDARGRVIYGVTVQDVLNVIMMALTISAGKKATECLAVAKTGKK